MRLCDYCVEHILESSESWDYHKCYSCLVDNAESTESSSKKIRVADQDDDKLRETNEKKEPKERPSRCIFCATLRQDVENLVPELQDHTGPIYRWSMTTLAKIRESLETIVVTFRQVPLLKKEGDVEVQQSTLPERTFYLFPEQDISPLPSIEQLGPSTDPAVNGGHQIKAWVETCNETHKGCMKRKKARSASAQFVPTRLLHIVGPPKSAFKVIETQTTPLRGPYATLSHCWGGDKFVELLPETRTQFMTDGVPWQMMTKNFQDAIEIVRFLGIEYIWIDSLCIIQGKKGDFYKEASRMHQVYRNSYCNIALVDSKNSKGGAFRGRTPSDVAPVIYLPREDSAMFGNKPWRIVAGDLWERDLLDTFLYVRGWVFQERMLSPRILHFAKNQVFWDCPSQSACETLPSGLPPPMDKNARPERHWRGRLQEPEEQSASPGGANDDSPHEFWRTAVQKYTSCDLTKGSDKLVAMWGIAKLVRDAMGVEYGAGLWEENLENQLTWRVAKCHLRERPSESKNPNLARNFPSWSWASMDGRIEVPDLFTQEPHYVVKDHFGSPLTFDLVGVKRAIPSKRPQLGASQPLAQNRGLSDSVVELQQRYKYLEQARMEPAGDAPKVVDRDAQPEFHHSAIAIQGQVSQGTLRSDSTTGSWFLRVEGLEDTIIEAFPDLLPQDEEPRFFFVVLLAKQSVRPKSREDSVVNDIEHEEEMSQINEEKFQPDKIEETDTDDGEEFYSYVDAESEYAEEVVIDGKGILMKNMGKDHFHRTGVFSFRNMSLQEFAKLQMIDSENLLSDMLHMNIGRKFWLD